MNPYWSELVHRLNPYVPGEQPSGQSFVKLNTNENPYPPSPAVLEAIRATTDERLRLYPDAASAALRWAIADFNRVTPDNVFVGNGSDEVLALSFMAFFTGGKPLMYPDVSYSFYPVYCDLHGIESTLIPVEDDMSLNLDRFGDENGGIIFPNPNAPTSRAIGLDAIKSLLDRNQHSVVLVDEAYVDFGAETAVPLIHQYPNLLISQTFSKVRSLAGLRIGFAIGDAGLIEALNRVKDSFNSYPIDWLAQAAATAAMEDDTYYQKTRLQIMQSRERVSAQLTALGFSVLPSLANFVFVTHPSIAANSLSADLRKAGILVRHWKQTRIAEYMRISIGTDSEMDTLVTALAEIVQGES